MTISAGDDNRAKPPEAPDHNPRHVFAVLLVTDLIVITTSSSPALAAITTGAGLLGLLIRCW